MSRPNTCQNCGSGLTYYSDRPTEGVCGNPDCVQHGEPQDYTMPLPDEAYMETKCSRCDEWDSECTCHSGKFKPFLIDDDFDYSQVVIDVDEQILELNMLLEGAFRDLSPYEQMYVLFEFLGFAKSEFDEPTVLMTDEGTLDVDFDMTGIISPLRETIKRAYMWLSLNKELKDNSHETE